jgi:hypothetical protein
MTRHSDQLPIVLADELLNAMTRNTGHLSINNAGKFVDHNQSVLFQHSTRDVCSELLAVAQDVIRSEPCRDC